MEEMRLIVRQGAKSMDVSLPAAALVKDLMDSLWEITNVIPRHQKLIFKGHVLAAEMSLKEAKLVSGSKIMLVAGSENAKTTLHTQPQIMKLTKAQEETRMRAWKSTGIVSFAGCALDKLPDEVWELGVTTRILDLGSTMIKTVPVKISCLTALQRLILKGNHLEDNAIPWNTLSKISLQILNLEDNCLTCLPMDISLMSNLTQLLVANNKLAKIHEEFGSELQLLEKLDLSSNRLKEIPSSIGDCSSLVELNLSTNFLTAVPVSIAALKKLKALNLSSNRLRAFPGEILKGCNDLITLSLHTNEVSIESLRELDGWKEFDARRKGKYDKQIDFHLMRPSDGFDEGADSKQTRRF